MLLPKNYFILHNVNKRTYLWVLRHINNKNIKNNMCFRSPFLNFLLAFFVLSSATVVSCAITFPGIMSSMYGYLVTPSQDINIIAPGLQVSGKAAEYIASATNTRASIAYLHELRGMVKDVGFISASLLLTSCVHPIVGVGVLAMTVTSPITILPPTNNEWEVVREVDALQVPHIVSHDSPILADAWY
ncbi:hypothetical protein EhV074 [Emiliania huxleyi virus 86]|uniref:Putative membrane protein n=2 Tax=Emiliania huxleyi virus 86 TaxID=181082 RepID=Q4A359_EHV8U|nr:hypothetical protein EhV074 [Emiliania huxleyi virus 86]UKZ11090.1 hypothetical protein EhVM1_000075 [Emiliania huxleyi virus M1]CAI65497.1 putative membrane protein [Emiliania huxleyi virus 86]CAZ69410.1 putative membrane protein [Emiliania huxleyi virus 99B1]